MQKKDTIATKSAILTWEEDGNYDPFASNVEADLEEDEAEIEDDKLS